MTATRLLLAAALLLSHPLPTAAWRKKNGGWTAGNKELSSGSTRHLQQQKQRCGCSTRGGDIHSINHRSGGGARWEKIETSNNNNNRRACGFYLWNAPSALLHKWCHFLLKDCTYEGRGGVKFARIAPGSMLQLLWPCSRYSADSCIFCGGSFQDHLALSWYKHMYTPLDNWLDRTLQDGKIDVPDFAKIAAATRDLPPQRGRSARKRLEAQLTKPNYVFHRRYVREAAEEKKASGSTSSSSSSSRRGGVTRTMQPQKQQQTSSNARQQARSSKKQAPAAEEFRAAPRLGSGATGVSYAVPAFPDGKEPMLLLAYVWDIVLDSMDNLIRIEAMENDDAK